MQVMLSYGLSNAFELENGLMMSPKHRSFLSLGVQGWRSGESTRLVSHRCAPGSIPRSGGQVNSEVTTFLTSTFTALPMDYASYVILRFI